MKFNTFKDFLDADPSNSIFLEELLRENLSKHTRLITSYVTLIVVTSVVFFLIQGDKEFTINFFGISLSGFVLKKNAISIVLSVLLVLYLKAHNFRKDLENSYRCVFTINHKINITYAFDRSSWLDEITRVVLPFSAISEMIRFSGPRWLRIIKIIFIGFPVAIVLQIPALIVCTGFFSIIELENKQIFDYVTLVVVASGFLYGMDTVSDFYDKLDFNIPKRSS